MCILGNDKRAKLPDNVNPNKQICNATDLNTVKEHPLMKWIIRIGYILLAAVVGFIFASILHTQSVLAKLTELNINITTAERFNTTWQDLLGLAPTYGLLILMTLTLSFSIAGLVNIKLSAPKAIIYPLAGGTGFLLMLLAMQPILGVTLIAGARGVFGLMLQVSAGIIAGICFAQLSKRQGPNLP